MSTRSNKTTAGVVDPQMCGQNSSSNVKNDSSVMCTSIIKAGINAGKQCSTVAVDGSVFCARHTPRVTTAKKEGPVCTALVTAGDYTGKQCTALAREGTAFCGRHTPR